MRISDWSSDVCSSDLAFGVGHFDCPVCIERNRDAPRHCAALMGVSTSLDTNGHRRPFNVIVSAPSTRSEEHTSELQSLMRISYAVFCLKKKKKKQHK